MENETTAQSLVAQMRDIHLPEVGAAAAPAAINIWPLVVALSIIVIAALFARERRHRWRRQALQRLREIEASVKSPTTNNSALRVAWQDLATLLRHIAICVRGKRQAGALTGDVWLSLLDDVFSTCLFQQGAGQTLLYYVYQPQPDSSPKVGLEQGEQVVHCEELVTGSTEMRELLALTETIRAQLPGVVVRHHQSSQPIANEFIRRAA